MTTIEMPVAGVITGLNADSTSPSAANAAAAKTKTIKIATKPLREFITFSSKVETKTCPLTPITDSGGKAAQNKWRKSYNAHSTNSRFLEVTQPQEVTVYLKAWSGGDRAAADQLMLLVYSELRKLAAGYLQRQRSDHTLQPTALVHEAYMKLIDVSQVDWQDRAHFFAVAAQTMRHILVDHARALAADKRGGGAHKIALDEAISFSNQPDIDLIALDEALHDLTQQDETQSRIIELRFFGGLTVEDTAAVLKISPATVKREWSTARAWLFRRMKSGNS
jgi:RNA polymerase sigma factor (TIGR02999 family)